MNASNTRTSVTVRVAAIFAAAAMTTLTLGTQLGLVAHCTSDADVAMLAAKRPVPVAQNASAAASQHQPG